MNLDLTTRGELLRYAATSVLPGLQAAYPETCRRVGISPSLVIETKKAHKAGERSLCSAILTVSELNGRGLAAESSLRNVRKFILPVFWPDIRKLAPFPAIQYINPSLGRGAHVILCYYYVLYTVDSLHCDGQIEGARWFLQAKSVL